jgi:hypothetical protein
MFGVSHAEWLNFRNIAAIAANVEGQKDCILRWNRLDVPDVVYEASA